MANTVLLCDDDVYILRAAEIKLKRSGFNVICAGDGQEAWEVIRTEVPDIVVTDCQMPRLNGIELTQRVRTELPATELPIIMLTAKSYELDRESLKREWGVTTVLDKPFSPRRLAELVKQVLETQPQAEAVPTS
jgi:two-component system alkaline phosphatase synthesis response regulator PhoP